MLLYWIWFAELPNIQLWQKHILLQYFSDPEELYHARKEAFLEIPDMTESILRALEDKDLAVAKRILRACNEKNIHLFAMHDESYPKGLKNTKDAPLVLYVKGTLPDFDNTPAIAIVGTRKATPYGMTVSRRIAAQIAACGGIVLSGGATGNDTMALTGALTTTNPVVAVLAGGLDVVYPKSNTTLFSQIEKQGCLISQYPPGTPHYRWNFPVRNRVLSGLSDGVLVVEAPENSGALITARSALEQGRDVFVVPGNIDVPSCAGSNALLQDRATAALSGWDIMKEYTALYPDKVRKVPAPQAILDEPEIPKVAEPVAVPKEKKERSRKIPVDKEEKSSYSCIEPDLSQLSEQEKAVYQCLTKAPRPVDDIISETGIPSQKVLSILTMLSIRSLAVTHPGGFVSHK
ncbi:MAG: DNA-protecting protein DprA [Ruminococcaceae bacterium]|nr:DNA-protecting protein DprA [Oscillospiraceae bacterium]